MDAYEPLLPGAEMALTGQEAEDTLVYTDDDDSESVIDYMDCLIEYLVV